jgi:molecular chaperone DnaJ
MQLAFEGEGNAGIKSGAYGALFIRIKVKESPSFRREKDDIYGDVKVPVITAVLGGKAPVETLHGQFELKIPAGTQADTLFRIKGKGMGKLRSQGFGDHYAKIKLEVPKRLSRQQKTIWKQLA